MTKAIIVIVVLALIAFVAFGQYISVKNTLVSKNETVKAAWSQVDIVLQRRADLIPNLVETVKGFAQQEQTVFGVELTDPGLGDADRNRVGSCRHRIDWCV